MKIIFLDIDGVLNRLGTMEQQRTIHTKHGIIQMEPELVQRFNRLVKDSDAKVVLSSSWRHSHKWRLEMFENGLDMQFIDRTPHLPGEIRGKEIDAWLKGKSNIEKYAILDDDDDMLPWQAIHFFKTDYAHGLTYEIAFKVTSYLLQ